MQKLTKLDILCWKINRSNCFMSEGDKYIDFDEDTKVEREETSKTLVI